MKEEVVVWVVINWFLLVRMGEVDNYSVSGQYGICRDRLSGAYFRRHWRSVFLA
jgi:hypothetical protein